MIVICLTQEKGEIKHFFGLAPIKKMIAILVATFTCSQSLGDLDCVIGGKSDLLYTL